MNVYGIPPDTAVFPNARTITLEGAERAILLLHGWTGYTGRLEVLAHKLHEAGFTVHVPRLPGHGTNSRDLQTATWRDWLRRAVDEYIDLRDRHPVVCVAGASMGAVLAGMIAAQFNPPRIAMLAPALQTRNRIVFLAPFLKAFLPTIAGDWSPENDPDPNGSAIGIEYKSRTYVSSVAELYRLQKRGRAALHRIRSDTLVVVSKADEAVPPSVADLVKHRAREANVRVLTLERSGHQMVQGVESDIVCQGVVDWFKDLR